MARIGDTHYEIVDGILHRRDASGAVEFLAVPGRPDFASGAAMSGVLYRVEWQPAAVSAARFEGADGLRDGGNCLHLACRDGDRRQWWCYRPRERDDGTLSLLAEWEPRPEPARRRLLGRR